MHVLLAKCDKLNRTEQARLMRESRAILGDAASAQLFSAHEGVGVVAAQDALVAALRGPVGAGRATR